jgi:hypothetical protein
MVYDRVPGFLDTAHCRKPGQIEIRSRWCSVSMAFPANVAEATLVKQPDFEAVRLP